jgi:hypothetical protein
MADIDLLPHAFHRPVRKTDSERRLFSQFDVAAFAGTTPTQNLASRTCELGITMRQLLS